MKHLAVSAFSTLLLSCLIAPAWANKLATENRTTAGILPQANRATVLNNSILLAEAETTSQFVTAEPEHPTTGTLKIIEEDGQQYLEFGDDFATVEGPAVQIILHRAGTVPVNIKEEDYMTIAPIQNFEGAQRYQVPAGVELNEYGSVAVWCQEFNVTFGYAQL